MPASSRSSNDFEQDYRRHFDQLTVHEGSFEQMLPAYRFGRDAATAPDTTGERFDDVEAKIRARFEVEHPGNSYEVAREAVRYGYDRATALKPGASDATLDQADEPLEEWERTLFQRGKETDTDATSRNMAIRAPQRDTPREGPT